MNLVRVKTVVHNIVDKSDGSAMPFIGLEDIESGTGRLIRNDVPLKTADSGICHRDGDVLFSKLRPYLAKSVLPETEGTGTGELLVLRPERDVDPRFLWYTTLSAPWLEWANTTSYGSKMPRTSWEDMSNFRMWKPALGEQRRIANFLDAETSRIDALIAKKWRMRELLALRRERIIDEALDLATPDGSTLVPLRHLIRGVGVGIVITPAAWYVDGGGIPALRGLNVKPGKIDATELINISLEGHALHRNSQLKAGEIVVVRTGKAGSAAVVPPEFDGANCIDLVIVRTSEEVLPRYVEYVLNSDYARSFVAEHSVGTIQSHFNVSAMKRIPIPAPSLGEQRKVVAMLDREIGTIDSTGGTIDRQLDVLAERRQALITAAVTGQLDVTTARSGVRV